MEEEKKDILSKRVKDILEWIYCIIIAIVLAVLIKYYIGTPTVVRMTSMYPTLVEQDRLVLKRVNRIGKKNKTAEELFNRGDIITFEAPSGRSAMNLDLNNPIAEYIEPEGWWNRFIFYVLEISKTSYIKRLIAFPGEHVEIKEDRVYINSEPLEEDYLDPSVKTEVKGMLQDFVVPENCVFAMGDNRSNSTDCREFGCVPLNKIEGKVIIRFFPFNKFGKVK